MAANIQQYLDIVKSNLNLESTEEREVLSELATHIEDEIQELKNNGLQEEEAASTCLHLLGSAKSLAHQIYEAHSQGTWRQALMASLPHLLFGILFLLNWWKGIGLVLMMLILILSTTVYGWWHRKTSWLFPWLGYSLLPVVAAGLSLLYLPPSFAWLAVLIYIPLALWLIYRIVTHSIRRDWVYLSLMLLPMPVIISWFFAVRLEGLLSQGTISRLTYLGPWISGSFLALALAVITFIRCRKRWLKISILVLTGIISISLISFYAWGDIDLIPFLLLMLFLGSIFFLPAWLANGARTGKWGKIFENHPMKYKVDK